MLDANAGLPLDEDSSESGAKPHRSRSGISLSLSGGGFRATLFHSGALRRLHELGILSRVRTITSVSGGSIMAAHLASVVATGGLPKTGDNDWDKRVAEPIRRLVSINLRRRLLMKRAIPWNWTTGMVELLARELESKLTKLKLSELPETPAFILCATDMSFGVSWEFRRGSMGDYQAGYIKKGLAGFPLARAAAASACFPPLLNPLPVKPDASAYAGGKFPVGAVRDRCISGLRLTDGGVYDNMGLEPVWKSHQTILVSDAGGLFDYSGDRGLIRRVLRYTDVVQNQARALRRRWLISSFSALNPDGTRVLNGTYWGTGSARTSYAKGDSVGYSKPFATETIARIRTDLNSFSEPEIAVLENHGYLLADIAVQVHASELYPQPPIALRIPHADWMDEEKARKALAV